MKEAVWVYLLEPALYAAADRVQFTLVTTERNYFTYSIPCTADKAAFLLLLHFVVKEVNSLRA